MSKYLIFVLLLAACAPEGIKYVEPDKNRMIIYKPQNWANSRSGTRVPVQINGILACDLHDGSYFTAPLTKNTLSISLWDMPGTSRFTTSHRYVRIELDGDKKAAMALGGLLGSLMAEGLSEKSGQFKFTEVDQSTAKKELQLLVSDCN